MVDPTRFSQTVGNQTDLNLELQALVSTLEVARGMPAFIFVTSDSIPVQRQVASALGARFAGVLAVQLGEPTDDAFEAACNGASGAPPQFICILGLDDGILSQEHGPAALTRLNASRELWRSRFSCPVVFFVSSASLSRIMLAAPDLWSRKSHLFEFAAPPAESELALAPPGGGIAEDMATWPVARRGSRLVELQARLGRLDPQAPPGSEPQRGAWLEECGYLFRMQGDYRAAAEAFEQAMRDADLAGEPRAFAQRASWAAFARQELGELKSANALVESALKRLDALEPKHTPQQAGLLSTQGGILRRMGKLEEARERMQRATAIQEQHFEPDHPTLATSYSNLALILQDLGDLKGARERMERAIAIKEKQFEPDHPTLATSYSNLALILQDLGDLKGARERMERAIAIQEKHFELDHPTLAVSYSNLAAILQDLGDLKGARERMERAIEIEEKHFEPDHPTLAVSYSNLAMILKDLGDLKGARARMERAIDIDEKNYDPDHPLLATRYNNLAHIDFAEGMQQAACAGWRRALAIWLKHFDEDHPNVRMVRANMKQAGCGE